MVTFSIKSHRDAHEIFYNAPEERFSFKIRNNIPFALLIDGKYFHHSNGKFPENSKKISKRHFFNIVRNLCSKYNIPQPVNSFVDTKKNFYGTFPVKDVLKHDGKIYRNAFAIRKGNIFVIVVVEKVKNKVICNFFYDHKLVETIQDYNIESCINKFKETKCVETFVTQIKAKLKKI